MIETRMPLTAFHRKLQRTLKREGFSPEQALGRHVMGDFLECTSLPSDPRTLRKQMVRAANMIGATIVQAVVHEFSPYGLSGVLVIAESHLSIHTWPEYDAACVDLFTCSLGLDPYPGFECLRASFGAATVDLIELPRGCGVAPGMVASSVKDEKS